MYCETDLIMGLKKLLDKQRFEHSLGVRDCADQLAQRYGGNREKARLAGLVHDCAKCIPYEKMVHYCREYGLELDAVCEKEHELIHGPLGAKIAEKMLGICDLEILNAVECHTTGKPGMSILDKIVYLADFIEPNRNYKGVWHLRCTAAKSLDEAVLEAFDNTICYVISTGNLLHPLTVEARNSILMEFKVKGTGK